MQNGAPLCFFALFHIQPPPLARALLRLSLLSSSPRLFLQETMASKGGWNATHDHIVLSLLFLFVLINFLTEDVVSGVASRPFQTSGCWDKVWSEHSIQQLFNIGPRHTGLWVSTGPLLIDPPLQPCIRNMYIQYRPGARSLKKWMDTSTGRWMAYSEKSIHLFNKSTTWVWLKISNLVSQFSDGSSSAVLRDLLMQFNFFVMSTMNGKEKQRQRNRSTG